MQGTKYCEGAVVVLASNSCTLPTFGRIIDIVMVDVDIPLFVCEIFETEEFVAHLHAFVVKPQKPIPTTILKQSEFADHHVLGLYKLNLCQSDTLSLYIVPKYNLDV